MVHYDPRPLLKYRQHPDNLIGSNLAGGAPRSPSNDAERTFSRLERHEHRRAPAIAYSLATTEKSSSWRSSRKRVAVQG